MLSKTTPWKSRGSSEPQSMSIVEPLQISGEDVEDLNVSPYCLLKGITALAGFRFSLEVPDVEKVGKVFQKTFFKLRPALWGYEACMLSLHTPPDLHRLLEIGNFLELKNLNGEFHICTNALEYFLQLGLWLLRFHRRQDKVFPKVLLAKAIENYNNMVIVSAFMPPKAFTDFVVPVETLEEIPQERPIFPMYLRSSGWETLKRAILERKSLQQLGTGLLEIFAGLHFPNDLHLWGLIRASQMSI
jgi:hypothetical protein